ncbi:MAG: hypothetical protein N2039_07230 [Gemmataceae bacterium]|nr:hypothetical protein [Gemmataceae bacterium]
MTGVGVGRDPRIGVGVGRDPADWRPRLEAVVRVIASGEMMGMMEMMEKVRGTVKGGKKMSPSEAIGAATVGIPP